MTAAVEMTVDTAVKPFSDTDVDEDMLGKELRDLFTGPTGKTRPDSDWSEALVQLKKNLAEVPKLTPCTEDDFLLRFLRLHDPQVAADNATKHVTDYYKLQRNYSELFHKVSEEKYREIYEDGITGLFPNKTADGRIVVMLDPGKWDTNKHSLDEVWAAMCYAADLAACDSHMQSHGAVLLVNCMGWTWQQLVQSRPKHIVVGLKFVDSYAPGYFTAVHLIKTTKIYDIMWAWYSPFMRKNLKDKMIFNNPGPAEAIKDIGAEFVPESLGGSGPEFDGKAFSEVFFNQKNLVHRSDQYGFVKETK